MSGFSHEGQLELFDLTHPSHPRPRRETLGWILLQLRYDQAVLYGIAGLIGLTVIFAGGVERGKRLARAERVLLTRQPSPTPGARTRSAAESPEAKRETAPTASSQPARPKPGEAAIDDAPRRSAPSAAPKIKVPTRVAASETPVPADAARRLSRYAVQVVTYTRPELAKRELDRLQARGERAFLVMREGRTVLYVGPFPSKQNARDKLTSLKPHYQDCFLKTL